MSEYTPTTEQVRHAFHDFEDFAARVGNAERPTEEESRDAFDRWLAQHDAEVRTLPDVETVAQVIRREWHDGETYEGVARGVLALFSEQPTAAEVRKQVAEEIAEALKRHADAVITFDDATLATRWTLVTAAKVARVIGGAS